MLLYDARAELFRLQCRGGGGGGGVTPIDSASSHYHDNRPWTCHTISGPPGPSVAEYLVPGGQPQGPCMAAIIDLGNRFCGGTIHGVAVIPIDSVVTTATAVNSQSRSKGCGQRSKLAQKYGQRWSQCGMIARKQSAQENNLHSNTTWIEWQALESPLVQSAAKLVELSKVKSRK